MDKQKDIQAILDLLADYTQKYNVDDKKHREVYNAILSLATTNTPATTKTKNKKAQSNEPKKDIYDLWTNIIKNGMQQI